MRRWICCLIVFCLLLPIRFLHGEAETSDPASCFNPAGADLIVSECRSDEWLNIAGMTKLPAVLTLCKAFDKGLIDENAKIAVSAKAASAGGPSAYLERGETVAASELIRAAVMISAGDAIIALYEHAFGSEDVFLNNIELVMKNAGVGKQLPDCFGTYMTFSCKDLIAFGETALMSPTFMKYCSQKYAVLEHASGRKTELASANKLLTTLPGCVGLFTGSSKSDGYCGIFAAKRGDTTYLCAVIGAQNSRDRFALAAKLTEEAFANYKYVPLCSADEPLIESYPVTGGDAETVDLYVKDPYSVLTSRSDGAVQKRVDLPETLSAPLDPEYSVGIVSFYDANGDLICERALFPGLAIRATGFRETLLRILRAFFLE